MLSREICSRTPINIVKVWQPIKKTGIFNILLSRTRISDCQKLNTTFKDKISFPARVIGNNFVPL